MSWLHNANRWKELWGGQPFLLSVLFLIIVPQKKKNDRTPEQSLFPWLQCASQTFLYHFLCDQHSDLTKRRPPCQTTWGLSLRWEVWEVTRTHTQLGNHTKHLNTENHIRNKGQKTFVLSQIIDDCADMYVIVCSCNAELSWKMCPLCWRV